ncbi:22832_t:CDS:2, partial [Cetraspora pellucida]
PEQEFHVAYSANKEENPYLQDNIPITNCAGLQENDLTQEEKMGLLLAPHDELATLYLNTEPQAENKNTNKTLPIME